MTVILYLEYVVQYKLIGGGSLCLTTQYIFNSYTFCMINILEIERMQPAGCLYCFHCVSLSHRELEVRIVYSPQAVYTSRTFKLLIFRVYNLLFHFNLGTKHFKSQGICSDYHYCVREGQVQKSVFNEDVVVLRISSFSQFSSLLSLFFIKMFTNNKI